MHELNVGLIPPFPGVAQMPHDAYEGIQVVGGRAVPLDR